MSRVVFQAQTPLKSTLHTSKQWARSLGFWGFGTGAAVFLLLSVTPLVRREVLVKTPLLSWYYEDKTPACDKPF